MIEIKNLNSGYNGTQILEDVSLVANPSEVTLIIGPNGSGKSTILKSIYNISNVYSGEIKLEDVDINLLKSYELINLGVSYVLQRNVIFGTLSVYENLEVAAKKYNDKKIIEKEIERVLDMFKFLKEKQSLKAGSLSGGQQRILAIAMALVQNPKVLLLDEPSAGLSPKAVKEVFEIVNEVKKQGITVLLVEQNVRLAKNIADKIYVLENGKIVHSGDKSILKDKKIKKVYLGG